MTREDFDKEVIDAWIDSDDTIVGEFINENDALNIILKDSDDEYILLRFFNIGFPDSKTVCSVDIASLSVDKFIVALLSLL